MATSAILAVSAGASILGGFAKHKEQEAQVVAQNQQLEQESRNEEINAFLAMKEGASKAKAIRSQREPVAGAQLSAAAASGVDVSSASIENLVKESAFNIEMDALNAQSAAKSEAEARRFRARNLRASKQGKPSKVGLLLGTAGRAASAFSQYQLSRG